MGMNITKLQKMIDKSKRIVFFGGAGVSTESGIPDFRSAHGLYADITAEEILSHSYFLEHTKEFYDFYRRKMVYPQAQPNGAHRKLAQMEQAGKLAAVITQNIDGLHQKAGSKKVLELHGSIERNYCQTCGKFYGLSTVLQTESIPKCSCGGVIKPDVVLYGEALDAQVIKESIEKISDADMLIVGGSSLTVYPAASLLQFFSGKYLVLLNKTVTKADNQADLVLHAGIGEVMKQISISCF